MKTNMRKIINKIVNKETALYIVFGFFTTVISYVLFVFITGTLGMKAYTANTIATAAAVLFAFVTNKLFVFESKNMNLLFVCKELLKFSSARLFTYIVETMILYVFVDLLSRDGRALKIATSVIIIVLNYILSKRTVFNTQKKD